MVLRLIVKSIQDKDYIKDLSNRFGIYKKKIEIAKDIPHGKVFKSYKDPVWFHAVSLGEVIGSQTIVREILHKGDDVILSVSTPTGLREAKKIYSNDLEVVYAPWDFMLFVNSFLRKFKPKALILFETEIWPSMIHACWYKEIPVILSNARLSEKSLKRYLRFGLFIKTTINKISLILAQSDKHVERFKKIGFDDLEIKKVGSVKFDINQKSLETFSSVTDNVILATSTHKNEEEIVVEAFKKLKNEIADLKLIVVPRHPERSESIAKIFLANQLKIKILSTPPVSFDETDVFIINSTGMLNSLYQIYKVAFIGGSLFKQYGGHNIIEPASNECSFIVGPHMKNFDDILHLFIENQACIQLDNSNHLDKAFRQLIKNNEFRSNMIDNALKVVNENKGSSIKQIKYINDYINKI